MKHNFFEYKDNFAKYKHIKSNLLVGEIENIPNPKITIAIPTYKRAVLISDSINSILNQVKFDDYEIIIIDNEATQEENETEKLMKQYNNSKILYYKNEENVGMFGNWNRCIELARGKYITILNDDDWLEEEFLYEMNKQIEGSKMIICDYITKDFRKIKNEKQDIIIKRILKKIYERAKKINKVHKLKLEDFFYGFRGLSSLGIIFERESMLKLGGYNEEYIPSCDYIFHTIYFKNYGGKYLKKELANCRLQENESMKEEVQKGFLKKDYLFRESLINYLGNKNNLSKINTEMTKMYENSLNELWNSKKNKKVRKVNKICEMKIKMKRRMIRIF
ncbi:glycosyltransferase family 2 protein [Fusobacterium ulcerans]|uniref:glycosyltransferase family 2 protein n=1 Tax=Fusobacterium ulcerans TaxID=861 RepID=UPI0030B73C01